MRIGDKRGFTAIQLILVVFIVGIVAAVITLGLGNLGDVRLDQAVNKVVGDLRYAQQLSITTQGRHGLEIDSSAQYTVHRDVPPDTAVPDPQNTAQTLVVNFDTFGQGQLAGVRFGSTTPFCGGGVIEFNSTGEPTDTNGTLLVCTPGVVVSYSGKSRTITIEPNTGNLTY